MQLAACFILMSFFTPAMAVLQGQSRQTVVAASFVVGAWCVGVPLAWALSRPAHMVSVAVAAAVTITTITITITVTITVTITITIIATVSVLRIFTCGRRVQGLVGLWLGMLIGYVVTTIISGGAVLLTNWDQTIADIVKNNSVGSPVIVDAMGADVPLLSPGHKEREDVA